MAAIYQPIIGGIQWLSTTLYPIDANDNVQVTMSFEDGSIEPIPSDAFEGSKSLVDGSYIQKRWFYTDGPYEDAYEGSKTLVDGSYIQKRWFYTDGPYEDAYEGSKVLIDGSYVKKRVFGDSPDEELLLTCAIESGTLELI